MIAIYARQSVERDNSVSIETQIDSCKRVMKQDESDMKIEIYKDEGRSGGNTDRQEFQKMMSAIKKGKIRKVITYKLDRISRSLSDFVGILQTFKDYNVEFVSSQESFDTSTIYGDLILKILIVFAEFERNSIISRVRDAYDKRTDMGIYMGGRKQYGFDLVDTVVKGIKTKKYVPIPEAIAQIQYIFEVYAQEDVSLRILQKNLLARGMKPIEGKDWTTGKISSILKNPAYVIADSDVYSYYDDQGVRIIDDVMAYNGEHAAFLFGKTTHDHALTDWSDMKLVLAQHGGVVPSGIWLRCQRKLQRNRQIGNSVSNQTSWLAGKLVCAKCGHTMTTIKSAKSNGEYRRYFNCTGKSHKKTCTGVKGTVYAEDLEQLVEGFIAEKLEELGTVKKSGRRERVKFDAAQNQIKLKLKEIEKEQRRLTEKVMEMNLNSEMMDLINKKATALAKEKQKLTDKLGTTKEEETEKEIVVHLSRRWNRAGFKEKKAVADILIDRIIMHENGTPEIVWRYGSGRDDDMEKAQ